MYNRTHTWIDTPLCINTDVHVHFTNDSSNASLQVVDCFMFNNELEMLELRLENHDSFVDRFVIIESPTTHSGQ